jgi:hypothetical protein
LDDPDENVNAEEIQTHLRDLRDLLFKKHPDRCVEE